jgi:DNA processing protein
MLFPTQATAPKLEDARPGAAMNHEEEQVYNAIGRDETHVNDIHTRSGLAPAVVNATLMKLELRRLIKPLPGKYYVRLI